MSYIPIPSGITSTIQENIVESYDRYRIALFTAISTAIILLVALSWNDVIRSIMAKYYPSTDDSIIGKIQYAFVITFIVVLLQIYIFPSLIETKKT